MTSPDDRSSSSPPEAGASRRRRARSVTESLLAVVLGLEAAVLFFAALTLFGLKALEPLFPAWAALPAGGIAIVLLVLATRVLRYPWGVAVGWVLQILLVALGFLAPAMFVVGGGFVLFWIYCLSRGRRIDRAIAARTAADSAGTAA